jgi:hypothetical protein
MTHIANAGTPIGCQLEREPNIGGCARRSSFAIARGQLFRALARHRKRRSRHGFRRYSASWRESGPDRKESQWRP